MIFFYNQYEFWPVDSPFQCCGYKREYTVFQCPSHFYNVDWPQTRSKYVDKLTIRGLSIRIIKPTSLAFFSFILFTFVSHEHLEGHIKRSVNFQSTSSNRDQTILQSMNIFKAKDNIQPWPTRPCLLIVQKQTSNLKLLINSNSIHGCFFFPPLNIHIILKDIG
jgi:hypothetical protein